MLVIEPGFRIYAFRLEPDDRFTPFDRPWSVMARSPLGNRFLSTSHVPVLAQVPGLGTSRHPSTSKRAGTSPLNIDR